MGMAIALFIVVVGTVLFGVFSPWEFSEIASKWKFIDVTVFITYWMTGVAFVLIGLFMAYCCWKFRHREGARADYDPENPRLEFWLTTITSIAVVVMLAPGLVVWEEYIDVPQDAVEVEVLAEQWAWSYRLPGEDGILGTADITQVSFENAFGLNDDDPHAQDDILIQKGSGLHVPINQRTKILLRSKDVLHDFWVPEIRAKMDAVPGMVTYFWFDPPRLGEYEVLCAELCGQGHYRMRSFMTVDSRADYSSWLDAQLTWAEVKAGVKPLDPLVLKGRDLAQTSGCFACHSLDGTEVVGPTWKGLWGRTVEFTDGTSMVVDENYLRKSNTDPGIQVVAGYTPTMIPYEFSEEDMSALLEFMKRHDDPAEEESEAGLTSEQGDAATLDAN
ncbi:MAG: cytochrome c oxidase subunit II [Pseudomonadales bacterium]|nr:cytochrome c oxidase subunit II [Pseudomonadales bacterium]